MHTIARWVTTSAVLIAAVGTAMAQSGSPGSIDAQEQQRQQARERALREQLETMPDVRLHTPADTALPSDFPASETPCTTIREIALDGSAQAFAWALAAADPAGTLADGRCLGSTGIALIMQRVQDAIIARGYVTTRVLANAQDLRAGILTLTILPGRIRHIRFAPDSGARANAFNAMSASPGDILNLRDIEQGLENLKRVPTAEADIQIVPGGEPGESDLLITWKQAFPFRITLSANDGGAESTGRYIGSATLSGDHLFTLNDLFYAHFTHDIGGQRGKDPGERGTRGHTLHYSVPYGYWLFGLTASKNRYHQTVAGASQDYLYSGTSENYEARLAHLVHRNSRSKTSLYLRGYMSKSASFIDDTEIEVQRRRMGGWEFGVQHRSFAGRAVADLNLAWRRGTGAFDATPAVEEAFGEGTHKPRILSADASLDLPFRALGHDFRYLGVWRAQWNRTPLVPQDRFSIGGRYSVRGFDGESVLMAERGWLLRNELGWRIGPLGAELYAGLDHGQVGGPSASLLVGRRLTGAVVGLRGTWNRLAWEIFTGKPLAKPGDFETPRHASGFNLTLSL
ncbi:ShlB/FhaC/HecB family hemolysin secretion/activation protein [Thauera linaloolentis]|uniref:Hemolysin activation/secretion protein n=1 Tax=Thauera linaloolentis (strain DSM 12138 / JCM 21573 / CCUG 41526 / CIP 105981 / IAM 15112 / NBRC 102519 / 47Lol) TaxID=1123367 RepID=N6Z5K8_THAL4|nr:ShlB/FhaC/HecB family hemolysin secretion/activation protein [Thauera linaloolentis]ENO89832.1 hemolysin activation/secretion protein [Thauera linaloolentis 47Lol = DSM 12138]MCM8566975.1 ShlB/FhaC/HecB family hemolysin secretion/activation protein [Thauera linaloolentis]